MKIKRKLAAMWLFSNRGRPRRYRGVFRDRIAGNHHYNKIGTRLFKTRVLRRKWNRGKDYYANKPGKGMKRKRYYVNR